MLYINYISILDKLTIMFKLKKMKKLLLLGIFAIFGSSSVLANQTSLQLKTEFFGGWCNIKVFYADGSLAAETIVWTITEDACKRKAQEYTQEVADRLAGGE